MTIIFSYYENPGLLAIQLESWKTFKNVNVIVVDDCSERFPLVGIDILYVRAFRIKKKTDWNWLACRNIGAKEAKSEWLMFLDIDHFISTSILKNIQTLKLDKEKVYSFSRVSNGKLIKDHSNSYLMTRKMYWHIGGYDERLSGLYSGTTEEFRKRVKKVSEIERLDLPIGYMSHDMERMPKIKDKGEVRRRLSEGKRKILTYDYEEIKTISLVD